MASILICDDHLMFAEALALAFSGHGFDVVAVHVEPAQAVVAAEALGPDACLVDRHFPRVDGMEYVEAFRRACPSTRVIILTGSSDGTAVSAARDARVDGFTRKDRGVEHVITTVARVLAGEEVIDGPVAADRRQASNDRGPAADLARFLTPREREVLQYLVRGVGTVAIAEALGISYPTARSHIQNVLTKLGVHSKLEAVAFSVAHNLATVSAESA